MTSVRGLLWRAGAPARLILLGAISLYRLTFSGWLGGQCRFSPTCSRYTEEAIRTHGALKGTFLGVGRVLRCNPFGLGGLDPVPPAARFAKVSEPSRWGSVYDPAIQEMGQPR